MNKSNRLDDIDEDEELVVINQVNDDKEKQNEKSKNAEIDLELNDDYAKEEINDQDDAPEELYDQINSMRSLQEREEDELSEIEIRNSFLLNKGILKTPIRKAKEATLKNI